MIEKNGHSLTLELIKIKTEMLFAKHFELRLKYYNVVTLNSKKLVCSLYQKIKYVVHNENLKFYLVQKQLTKTY